MSDDIRLERDEDGEERGFRSLLRESQYAGRPRDAFRRDLLRELNHNFSHHRSRLRMLVAACGVVVAGGVLLQTQELGGDVFDMIPRETTEDGVQILDAPFSGRRMAIAEPGGLSPEQINEMRAAGMGEIIEVDAYTFDGTTRFNWTTKLTLDGRSSELGGSDFSDSEEEGRRILAFFEAGVSANLEAIRRGELPPQGTKVVHFDGRDLTMDYWIWDFPGVGRMEFARWER